MWRIVSATEALLMPCLVHLAGGFIFVCMTCVPFRGNDRLGLVPILGVGSMLQLDSLKCLVAYGSLLI